MAEDKMKVVDKLDAEVVKTEIPGPKDIGPKDIGPMVPGPKTASIHILRLPPTTSPTDLFINGVPIKLPAGQPTVAIEAEFPFTAAYGSLKRSFTGQDPFIPKTINHD